MEIPDSVTSIGSEAFYNCTNLTSIEIPNSVTSIERKALGVGAESIFIPASTKLSVCAICKCKCLKSIDVDTKNPYYRSVDGVLYKKDLGTLIKYPDAETGSFLVPSETTVIGEGAFCNACLSSIRIGESIKAIEHHAFYESRIQELHIKNKCPETIAIGEDAFKGLKNCTLYVPIGTGYRYRHDKRFIDKFKEVIIEKQEW